MQKYISLDNIPDLIHLISNMQVLPTTVKSLFIVRHADHSFRHELFN